MLLYRDCCCPPECGDDVFITPEMESYDDSWSVMPWNPADQDPTWGIRNIASPSHIREAVLLGSVDGSIRREMHLSTLPDGPDGEPNYSLRRLFASISCIVDADDGIGPMVGVYFSGLFGAFFGDGSVNLYSVSYAGEPQTLLLSVATDTGYLNPIATPPMMSVGLSIVPGSAPGLFSIFVFGGLNPRVTRWVLDQEIDIPRKFLPVGVSGAAGARFYRLWYACEWVTCLACPTQMPLVSGGFWIEFPDLPVAVSPVLTDHDPLPAFVLDGIVPCDGNSPQEVDTGFLFPLSYRVTMSVQFGPRVYDNVFFVEITTEVRGFTGFGGGSIVAYVGIALYETSLVDWVCDGSVKSLSKVSESFTNYYVMPDTLEFRA